MIPDFVQQTIEEDKEGFYESCNNCEVKSSVLFEGNSGKLCSGHIRHPSKNTPFDIIRLCMIKPDNCQYYDLAPDEALEISMLLADTVNRWLYNTKEYKKFRRSI